MIHIIKIARYPIKNSYESSTNLLINPNRPGAERDPLAERLHPPRHGPIPGDPDILPVDAVEAQGGQVVGCPSGAGGAGRWNKREDT